jgi:hypothetical protein
MTRLGTPCSHSSDERAASDVRGVQLAARVREALVIPVLAVVAAASVLFALQVYRDTRWPVSPESWRWAIFHFPRFSDAQLAWVFMEVLYGAAVVIITIVFVGWLRLLGLVLAVLVIYGASIPAHFLIRRRAEANETDEQRSP